MKILKETAKGQNFFIALIAAVLMFDFQYYVMKNTVATKDLMCVMGGNFTFFNVSFAAIMSILIGMMTAGFVSLYKMKNVKAKAITVSGVGAAIGTLTMFCTICTFQVVSIFGISLGLGFFTDYNIFFKVLSLVLMLYGIYKINSQLNESCSCQIK